MTVKINKMKKYARELKRYLDKPDKNICTEQLKGVAEELKRTDNWIEEQENYESEMNSTFFAF